MQTSLTPTAPDVNAHRIADVLYSLETCPAVDFRVRTALARRVGEGARWVVAAIIDGAEHRLEPNEAETTAKCLRMERAFPGARAVAQAFDDATAEARRLNRSPALRRVA